MIYNRRFLALSLYAIGIAGFALVLYFEDEGRLAYRFVNSTVGFTLMFASGIWVRSFRSFFWLFGAALAACALNAFLDGDPKWPRTILYFSGVYAFILAGQWWLRRKEPSFI